MNRKYVLQLITTMMVFQFLMAPSFGQTHRKQSKNISKSLYKSNQPASFPGGTDSLYLYLKNRIRYPAQAREDNVQGKVVLSFLINETGYIENIRTLRSIGSGCGLEAIRVIKGMPKWNPQILNGVTKKMLYILPIEFRLRD